MFSIFIFVIGYFLGGITAVVIIAIAVAARRYWLTPSASLMPAEEIWHRKG
jgi:hypothetical protein